MGHGQGGDTALRERGNGDTSGEGMKMKDTNLEGAVTSSSMAQCSAGGASPNSQGCQGSPASQRGQAVLLLCAPSPGTPVPAVLLSQALHTSLWIQAQAIACSAVLCPGNQQRPGAGHSWGGSQAVPVTAGSGGREKQQLLAALRYHQASREASQTESFSLPTVSSEENGTRSPQGCSHLAETF